jgi:hypothetical protein
LSHFSFGNFFTLTPPEKPIILEVNRSYCSYLRGHSTFSPQNKRIGENLAKKKKERSLIDNFTNILRAAFTSISKNESESDACALITFIRKCCPFDVGEIDNWKERICFSNPHIVFGLSLKLYSHSEPFKKYVSLKGYVTKCHLNF